MCETYQSFRTLVQTLADGKGSFARSCLKAERSGRLAGGESDGRSVQPQSKDAGRRTGTGYEVSERVNENETLPATI